MSTRKIYAGARLGEIRRGLGLTQTAFARALGVSLSYLNQMERNNRPVSRTVVQGLAERFAIDVAAFSMDEGDRLMADLREALADPVFRDTPHSGAERQIVATNAPGLAHAFLALHRAYRQGQERLASLDEALARGQLALDVLNVDAALAAAETGLGAAGLKFVEDVLHGDSLPCDVTPSSRLPGGFRAPCLRKL